MTVDYAALTQRAKNNPWILRPEDAEEKEILGISSPREVICLMMALANYGRVPWKDVKFRFDNGTQQHIWLHEVFQVPEGKFHTARLEGTRIRIFGPPTVGYG